MRRWLPATAYDRPVTVFMAFVACLVIGLVAWSRIPVQMMPSGFEPRMLWVWVSWPDATPTETDESVVMPVLGQLRTIPGITSIRSEAEADSASFRVELGGEVDVDEAYNAIVDRMERAMLEVPDDVERYGIWRYNPDDQPVIWAGISFPDDVSDPNRLVEKVLRPRIERIGGVAALDVWGVNQRNLEVHFDRERVMAHGVNLGEVQQRLSSDNFQSAGGRIEDRGLVRHVRSLARFPSIEALARFPVKDGVVLSDIADIGFVERAAGSVDRVDGSDGAAMGIRKASQANAVDLAREVREAFAELEADPRLEGARLFVFFDQGALISESIDNLTFSALTGGVFAVIILFAFLREWRMTLLIAASIPFSLMLTVGVLYFRGDSLNLLALMGLMLAVGMVVDNAIVVVETIYRRRARGASLRDAAIDGTAEVNLAIVLSTMTTMVVFLPLILMGGGDTFSFFLSVLGVPVIVALAASLLVALVFAPVATRLIGSADVRPDPAWLAWASERYARSLSWVLRHRLDAAVMFVGMCLLTFAVPMKAVQCTSSDTNVNDFSIRFTVPPQASPSERDDIVRRFEQLVEERRERWGVSVYRSRLGSDDARGRVFVYLDADATELTRDEVMTEARKALPKDIPGVTASIGWERSGGGGGANQLGLVVSGEDMATLRGLGEEIARRLGAVDGVLSASLDYEGGGTDEIRLEVDPVLAADYGVDARTVGTTVAYAMRTNRLPPLWIGEREIEVLSQFALEDRSDVATLGDFPLFSPTRQRTIPVRSVTDVVVARGPGEITRHGSRTSVTVTADLEEGVTVEDAWPLAQAALGDMVLPRGYSWSRGEQFDTRAQEDAAMGQALLLSVVFVFLLMGVLFESFLLPVCVIVTIPMAMMGTLWGLWATGTPLDTMAGVGLVILVGVVVNNGIVLVDLVTQLRAEGVPRDRALVEAGRRRLRPILMTALTTICGLVPMALGTSAFVGIPYFPLGRAVIAGLAAATGLTLLFVPWLYTLLDDLRAAAGGWLAFARRQAPVAVALLALGLGGAAHAERPLTIDDVLDAAVAGNPNLARSALERDRSRGDLMTSRGIFDPTFSTTGRWRRSTAKGFFQGFPFDSQTRAWDLGSRLQGTASTGTTWSLGLGVDRNLSTFKNSLGEVQGEFLQDAFTANVDVSITQQLLEGHRRAWNLRNVTRARDALDRAELALERTRQETLAAASRAYWTWVTQRRLAEIADQSVRVAEESLRVGTLQVDAGELAPVERTRLEAAVVQARADALTAQQAANDARDQVLLLMGEPPGQDVLPATEPGAPSPFALTVDEATEVALAQNLELAVARAALASARTDARASRHALLPSLSATVASGRGSQVTSEDDEAVGLGSAITGLVETDAFPYLSVSGELSVPIGNRAARGEVRASEATVETRRIDVEETERRIRAEVARQVEAVLSARRQVELAEANRRLAEEVLRTEEALFEAGRAITKDVLEARAEADRARAAAVRAVTDHEVAIVELMRLQGLIGER